MGCRHSIQAASGVDAAAPKKSTQNSDLESQELHQVDEPSVALEQQQPLHGWDDSTKDYQVIKQITGGAVGSGLSTFYVVVKHGMDTTTDPVCDEAEDDCLYILQVIGIKSVAPERRKAIKREIQSMKEIQHPNILRVCDVYDSTRKDSTISIVTEMCTGQHLHSTTPYPEARVRTIVTQILSALRYMHTRGLFHNNLTTENILFHDDSQDAIIKITYAGVASAFTGSNKAIMSPDWDQHGRDVYSVGMIAYKLMSGDKEPPTDMDTQLVAPGTNLFFGRRWKLIQISRSAKQFIEQCLQPESARQMSVEQAMRHPWITQERSHRTVSRPTVDVKANVDSNHKVKNSSAGTNHAIATAHVVPVSLSTEQYNRNVESRQRACESESESKSIAFDTKPFETPVSEPNLDVDTNSNTIPPTAVPTNDDEIDIAAKESDSVSSAVTDPLDPVLLRDGHVDDTPAIVRTTPAVPVPHSAEQCSLHVESVVNGSDGESKFDAKPVETLEAEPNLDVDTYSNTIPVPTNDDEISIAAQECDSVSSAPTFPLDVVSLSDFPVDDVLDIVSIPFGEEHVTATPAEFLDFQEIFQQAESEKGEEMTVEYLKAKFATKYTEEEVNSWFQGGKFDITSNLQYTELLATVIKSRRTIEVRHVKEAFQGIDKGKRGFVTVGNLRAVLGANNNEDIEMLIKAADSKRDGRISYADFAQVVKQWAGEDLT